MAYTKELLFLPSSSECTHLTRESKIFELLLKRRIPYTVCDCTDQIGSQKNIKACLSQREEPIIAVSSAETVVHLLRFLTIPDPRIAGAVLISPHFPDSLRTKLSRIEVPVLIINGADDTFAAKMEGMKLHDLIENSSYRTIKGCGRSPYVEQPLRFLIYLDKFLSDEF